jgi:tellurite resistance protein TerC
MDFESVRTPLLWGGFITFVIAMLALDLGVFHKHAHTVRAKEAATWTVVWVALAAIFNLVLYFMFGHERALEFTAGYLIEKALAVDNIFVFVVIFRSFGVPARDQHRVLFWGVLGALVMRAGFILAGGALLASFSWAMRVFGLLLIITGVRLMLHRQQASDAGDNRMIRVLKRFLPATDDVSSDHFTVVKNGKRLATPLLLALVAVEISDLVFAVDSIPAIFAITRDPFIVFTSNIFAIMGLRSLYFLLAGVIDKFVYLSQGLAVVLMFVGGKMMLAHVLQIPIALSLGVIAGILGVAMLSSWLRTRWVAAHGGGARA